MIYNKKMKIELNVHFTVNKASTVAILAQGCGPYNI